mmetsp:Transcript_29844/g.80811  ORF Transcript_29844/g.80811 Transcript_29844/m.80811 type:complete len:360 (-) Transcript_29844:270-1349(-)
MRLGLLLPALAMASSTPMLPELLDIWTVVPVTRSLVELGVPDAIPEEGAVDVKTVAERVGLDPEMLYRAIRFVAGAGVFEESGDGRVSHAEVSLKLRTGGGLRNKILVRAAAENVMMYADGFASVLKDPSQSAFRHLFKEDYFAEWLPRHPGSEATFGKYMSDASAAQIPSILAAYPWPQHGVIADVAGGNGHLLRALVTEHPGTTGVLFDLPSTIATARTHWPQDDVMHSARVAFQPGDFFESVDVSADVYVLKWILHDWVDDRCTAILSNIRAAAKADSVLMVIDMLMPEDMPSKFHIAKFYDIHMAAGFGGKERTRSQMRTIAEAAGWELQEVRPVGKSPFACFVLQQKAGLRADL